MIKILITPQGFEIFGNKTLKNLFGEGYEIDFVGGQIQDKKELISKLKDVDGCIIGAEKIDKEILDSCPNLKILSRFGIGYNSIDINETNLHNVMVTIVPDMNPLAVARHCLSLLLALTNNIIKQNEYTKRGKWIRHYNLSPEDNKIGLIGLGPIGIKFGELCKNLGYDVNYYSRSNKNIIGFNYIDSIDKLIKESQIVSLHIKSVPETKNIINKDRIDMLENKYLLNTARGDLIDERYLYKSLIDNKLSGVGLDVFLNEPSLGISQKIQKLDNVVSTCHISSYDNFSVSDVGLKSIKNIKSFFEDNFKNINKIVKD